MKEAIFSVVLLVTFIAAFLAFAAGIGYWSAERQMKLKFTVSATRPN